MPVLERPSSLGRVWEMGPHGNRLWHSLRCEGPRGQPWGKDPGATTSPRGAAAAPHLPCPAPCPTPHRHPGVRGRSASPALPLKIENLKTSDFHSAKNSHWRLGAGAQGTLAPASPHQPLPGWVQLGHGIRGAGRNRGTRSGEEPRAIPCARWPRAWRLVA